VTQASAPQRTVSATSEDANLAARLRAGDEQAFETLVGRHYATMLAVARSYVKTRAEAEEVVQEAWIGVLKGIDGFEGRSSLKTWVLRILVNTAKRRGAREAFSVPFSSLAAEGDAAAVEPDRFRGSNAAFPGHWNAYPSDWRTLPEERLLGRETLAVVMEAIEGLPDGQRAVITLRDVEGWSSAEVCRALELREDYQRVLLHRARSRVRTALEHHLDG
jgi:RNA polymerase sigma-70 factor, ECF subfamily